LRALRDALGGHDQVSLEKQLEGEIEQLRDALGGRDREGLEMHLEAEIE
jgi:hypothetical protein